MNNIPQEPTQEQMLLTAKILQDNADHPIQIFYTKLFNELLDGNYYTLSHLPFTDSIEKKMQKIENISGRIKMLEELIEIPKNYAEYAKSKAKEK
jgi:hypothetical protein